MEAKNTSGREDDKEMAKTATREAERVSKGRSAYQIYDELETLGEEICGLAKKVESSN